MSAFVMQAHIEACEELIEYTFTDKMVLGRALNASGNHRIFQGQVVQDNKALAIFGDTAMASRLCRQWLETGASRAVWDSIRKNVLDNANLARAGNRVGLEPCITTHAFTQVSVKMMAIAVEAIAGAAYLDGGEVAMAKVMQAMELTDARLGDAATVVSLASLPLMPRPALGIGEH